MTMGQKDLWQSDYFDNNVRFADLYNGIFFNGAEIIKPKELEPCDSVFVQHFQNRKTVKVICDKARKFTPIIPLILFGQGSCCCTHRNSRD